MQETSGVKFSVIVPTHNRASSLRRTLENLFAQRYDGYEILVVDDGSTDETGTYLSSLPSSSNLKIIRQSNQGPAAARNAGIAASGGLYIAFTDDDCVAPPEWLRQFDLAFQQTGADVIGGAVQNCLPGNMFAEVSQDVVNYFVRHFGKESASTTFLTSNNIAYRAETIRRMNGFDARFRRPGGEERALHLKIISNGGVGKFIPGNTMNHYHDLTFTGFIHQHLNYGRGSYILYNVVAPECNSAPSPIPLSVYSNMLLHLLAKNGWLRGILSVTLAVLGQLAVIAGYVLEAIDTRARKPAAIT